METGIVGCGECGITIHLTDDIPLYTKPPVLNAIQFDSLIKGLEECGKIAKKYDMAFALHPHLGTGIQSSIEIENIMKNTDPEHVGLIFDTGHIAGAGEDPVKELEKHIKRVRLLHVKDCNSKIVKQMTKEKLSFLQGVRNGLFAVPGDGDLVDWDGIFFVLEKSNYCGWIIVEAEQDPNKKNPLEYTKKARKYIREKTGI
jgi:inosose dehydratase